MAETQSLKNLPWPKNHTQEEVIKIIDEVVDKIAPKFRFGYYDIDDIKQEGRIKGLMALHKYDESRPLRNFLYVHIHNRLINFVRDNYYRANPPCEICSDAFDKELDVTQHKDGKFCRRWNLWKKRITFKINSMRPIDIDNFNEEAPNCFYVRDNYVENTEAKEIYNLIEMKIPVHLRKYFLQLTSGINVSPYRKAQLIKVINEILTEDEIERLINAWEEKS